VDDVGRLLPNARSPTTAVLAFYESTDIRRFVNRVNTLEEGRKRV
jgi:hypothetical protein